MAGPKNAIGPERGSAAERACRRVAVTGLGAVTSLGRTVPHAWTRLIAGRTGIVPLAAPGFVHGTDTLAAVIPPLGDETSSEPRRFRRLDRCHRLALMAAREALSDSGLAPGAVVPHRAGIFVGTSLGGMLSAMRYDRERRGSRRRFRKHLVRYPFHVVVDELCRDTGFIGPRGVVSTACTASTIALLLACEAIQDGEADFVLAGGVDPLTDFTLAGFNAMKNVSHRPCAPFSKPPGLTLGEAASFLLLERLDHAEVRGARIYAELLGGALTADAYHATLPDPTGASQRRLLDIAFARAGVSAGDVDYVNAHGTGTEGNDVTESRVLELLLGDRAQAVPVSSLKGALGHCLGAAGAAEAMFTALALHQDLVPPTANFAGPRPGCDLDYVPDAARAHAVRIALTQNFAFGGNNAALVFAEPRAATADPPPPREVVVTGIGIVSPIGIGRAAFRRGIERGESGLRPAAHLAAFGADAPLTGALADFDPQKLTRAQVRRLDRLSQLVVVGTELAVKDAGLRVSQDNAGRIGIVVGTMNGPIGSCGTFHEPIALGRPEAANPMVFPNTVFNACAGQAAINLRVRGPNVATTLGQASGMHALAIASAMVRNGHADVLIAGGADELVPDVIEGHAVARVLSPLMGRGPEGIHPFGCDANGMVLGEGSGFLVLESRTHAEARGARILARITGWSSGAETANDRGDGEGLATVIVTALGRAGLPATEIGMCCAAGLAVPALDRAEIGALRRVFGHALVPVTTPTTLFGVSGACTALGAAATVLGLSEGFIPGASPRRGHGEESDLDLVCDTRWRPELCAALVNGMSFGGSRVALVLEADRR